MTNEELVEEYQRGNSKVLEEIIKNNEGIINKLTNKFYIKSNAIDIDDIKQEGYIGLIAAANKYDINNPKKANFITYATHWIYQRMYKLVVGKSSRGIANNELNNNCTSLNTPVGLEGDVELQDIIECEYNDIVNIDEQLYLKQLRKDLNQAMKDNLGLTATEVLKLHYGWDIDVMSYDEIADILNIESKDIRNIHYGSLNKLRHSRWARMNISRYLRDGFIG